VSDELVVVDVFVGVFVVFVDELFLVLFLLDDEFVVTFDDASASDELVVVDVFVVFEVDPLYELFLVLLSLEVELFVTFDPELD